MRPGLDWVGLVWLATDAGLFAGALLAALRTMRRIRWAPALLRRVLATFGWYALTVTALMVTGQALSPAQTIYGALFVGSVLSAGHLLVMASILFVALIVALPAQLRPPARERRDG